MSSFSLPTVEEVASLLPEPGSLLWERGSDARLGMGAVYALLMQVAHPVVGAGVQQHSGYQTDPLGRLIRTLDYVTVLIYGKPEEARRAGRQLRATHGRMQGVGFDGRSYHALDPGAFAWVHATLLDAMVRGHRLFGRRMSPSEVEQFYLEFKRLGLVHGVREGDLPPTYAGFQAYFDGVVETQLGNNEAVEELLGALRRPMLQVPRGLRLPYRAARIPLVHLVMLGGIGMLPPVLRERIGVTWSSLQDLELRLLGAASRATSPLLPKALRITGPNYLRLRRGPLRDRQRTEPKAGQA